MSDASCLLPTAKQPRPGPSIARSVVVVCVDVVPVCTRTPHVSAEDAKRIMRISRRMGLTTLYIVS